jgi:hypothetical protein
MQHSYIHVIHVCDNHMVTAIATRQKSPPWGKFKAFSHLGLSGNKLKDEGVQRLALGQCKSLSFLNMTSPPVLPHRHSVPSSLQSGVRGGRSRAESSSISSGTAANNPKHDTEKRRTSTNGLRAARKGLLRLRGGSDLIRCDLPWGSSMVGSELRLFLLGRLGLDV